MCWVLMSEAVVVATTACPPPLCAFTFHTLIGSVSSITVSVPAPIRQTRPDTLQVPTAWPPLHPGGQSVQPKLGRFHRRMHPESALRASSISAFLKDSAAKDVDGDLNFSRIGGWTRRISARGTGWAAIGGLLQGAIYSLVCAVAPTVRNRNRQKDSERLQRRMEHCLQTSEQGSMGLKRTCTCEQTATPGKSEETIAHNYCREKNFVQIDRFFWKPFLDYLPLMGSGSYWHPRLDP
jgi:hypothetical protein